ncbi:MAG TPA: serine hydrolase, partial [Gemmatimonadales bacterium]|nr:serine hydrolase [Gemmatimonadales bacterium]
GSSYERFLAANIFQPLGMTSTASLPDDTIVPGRVRGFIPGPPPFGVIPAPWSDHSFDLGSGSLVSTVRDLRRWALAVLSDRLYRRSSFPYPYGWGRLGSDQKAGIEQTGLGNGFTASLAIWWADSLQIIVLGNIESAQWGRWSADLASIARGVAVPVPSRRVEVTLPEGVVACYAGRYETADHRVEIRERGGSLWAFLDDWPIPKYLAPVGRSVFELRSDFGRLDFDTTGAAPSTRMVWIFGPDARTAYTRVVP